MKKESINTFSEGLITDLNPISTPNNVLTYCLNGTMVTYNGNEFILQNDMGNGKVDEAFLPSGFIPVGMQEHGGIIYVASYNPILEVGQIGSFPSPEQTKQTDIISPPQQISSSDFIVSNNILGKINHKLVLSNQLVFSGDEFGIHIDGLQDIGINFNLQLGIIDKNNKVNLITEQLKTTDGKWWTAKLDNGNPVVDQLYKGTKGKIVLFLQLKTLEEYNCEVLCDKNIDGSFNLQLIPNVDKTKIKGHQVNLNDNINNFKPLDIISLEITKEPTDNDFLKYDVVPITNFGILKQLGISGSIKLSLVNSGELSLNSWRYFYEGIYMNLNWELEYYPKKDQYIEQVTLNMYDLTETNPIPINIPIGYQPKFGGNFNERFILNDFLIEGYPYFCLIEVHIKGGEVKKFGRFMIASDDYNDKYYLHKDFSTANLGINVDSYASLDSEVLLEGTTTIENGDTIPIMDGNTEKIFKLEVTNKDVYNIKNSAVISTSNKNVEILTTSEELINYQNSCTSEINNIQWVNPGNVPIETTTITSTIVGSKLNVTHNNFIKANSKVKSLAISGTIFRPYLNEDTEEEIFGSPGISTLSGTDKTQLVWELYNDGPGKGIGTNSNSSAYGLRLGNIGQSPETFYGSPFIQTKWQNFKLEHFYQVEDLYKNHNKKVPNVLFQTSWDNNEHSKLLTPGNTFEYTIPWIKDRYEKLVPVCKANSGYFTKSGQGFTNAGYTLGMLYRNLYVGKNGNYEKITTIPKDLAYISNYNGKVNFVTAATLKKSPSFCFKKTGKIISATTIKSNAIKIYGEKLELLPTDAALSNINYTFNTVTVINKNVEIMSPCVDMSKYVSIYNAPEMSIINNVLEFKDPVTKQTSLIDASNFNPNGIYYLDQNSQYKELLSDGSNINIKCADYVNSNYTVIGIKSAFELNNQHLFIDSSKLPEVHNFEIGYSINYHGDYYSTRIPCKTLFL